CIYSYNSLQSYDQRNRKAAHCFVSIYNTLCYTVTTYDTTKDVDKDRFYVWIFKYDSESFLYSFSISCTTHVQEVRRITSGQFNDVHGSHCKTGTVYHTGNITVKFYKVKSGIASFNICWIFLTCISKCFQVFVTEKSVTVQGYFSINSNDFIVRCLKNRVDFEK